MTPSRESRSPTRNGRTDDFVESVDGEKLVVPKATINPVSSKGKLAITFNTEMDFPPDFVRKVMAGQNNTALVLTVVCGDIVVSRVSVSIPGLSLSFFLLL